MKKVVVAIILSFLITIPSNGFYFKSEKNFHTNVPPFLFWKWKEKDVIIISIKILLEIMIALLPMLLVILLFLHHYQIKIY